MAKISLVLFATLEVDGEFAFSFETQEVGRILDVDESGKLLDAVCDVVGRLPPGEDVTTDGDLR